MLVADFGERGATVWEEERGDLGVVAMDESGGDWRWRAASLVWEGVAAAAESAAEAATGGFGEPGVLFDGEEGVGKRAGLVADVKGAVSCDVGDEASKGCWGSREGSVMDLVNIGESCSMLRIPTTGDKPRKSGRVGE